MTSEASRSCCSPVSCGGFPHRTLMQEIAEHNAKEALALLVQ
ncbi:hypothetical protein [Streptomyces sp. NBC_01643]|nr:hypothetical protein OHB03_38145 [Streptomyces sp. NBC_01643]